MPLAQIVSPAQVNPFNLIHTCHELLHRPMTQRWHTFQYSVPRADYALFLSVNQRVELW